MQNGWDWCYGFRDVSFRGSRSVKLTGPVNLVLGITIYESKTNKNSKEIFDHTVFDSVQKIEELYHKKSLIYCGV